MTQRIGEESRVKRERGAESVGGCREERHGGEKRTGPSALSLLTLLSALPVTHVTALLLPGGIGAPVC
jgi:hypothetical protein